jgi:hypothetical protein
VAGRPQNVYPKKSLLGNLIKHDGVRHRGALVAGLQNDVRRRDGASPLLAV